MSFSTGSGIAAGLRHWGFLEGVREERGVAFSLRTTPPTGDEAACSLTRGLTQPPTRPDGPIDRVAGHQDRLSSHSLQESLA